MIYVVLSAFMVGRRSRGVVVAIAACVAVVCLLVPRSLRAQPSTPKTPVASADAHWQAGIGYYKKRDFAAAAREFDLAYKLVPTPARLFALAQAHRLADNCTQATAFYTQFLSAAKSEQQTQAAQQGIDRCKSKLKPKVEPKPKLEPKRIVEPARPIPPPQPPIAKSKAQKRWYSDGVVLSVVGAGFAAGLAGAGFYAAARRDITDSASAGDYDEYASLVDRAGTRRLVGTILGGVGGALIIVGMVRALSLRGPGDSHVQVSVTSAGMAVAWSGGF